MVASRNALADARVRSSSAWREEIERGERERERERLR
jgi:hypothetical protein